MILVSKIDGNFWFELAVSYLRILDPISNLKVNHLREIFWVGMRKWA